MILETNLRWQDRRIQRHDVDGGKGLDGRTEGYLRPDTITGTLRRELNPDLEFTRLDPAED